MLLLPCIVGLFEKKTTQPHLHTLPQILAKTRWSMTYEKHPAVMLLDLVLYGALKVDSIFVLVDIFLLMVFSVPFNMLSHVVSEKYLCAYL